MTAIERAAQLAHVADHVAARDPEATMTTDDWIMLAAAVRGYVVSFRYQDREPALTLHTLIAKCEARAVAAAAGRCIP